MSNRRRPQRGYLSKPHPLSMVAAAQRRLREKLAVSKEADKPEKEKS